MNLNLEEEGRGREIGDREHEGEGGEGTLLTLWKHEQ